LRRKKQFAMVGPATNSRVEVGLNMKAFPEPRGSKRSRPGEMCQYRVRLAGTADVDKELLAWMWRAYDEAE
jgi:hypothetical protein